MPKLHVFASYTLFFPSMELLSSGFLVSYKKNKMFEFRCSFGFFLLTRYDCYIANQRIVMACILRFLHGHEIVVLSQEEKSPNLQKHEALTFIPGSIHGEKVFSNSRHDKLVDMSRRLL